MPELEQPELNDRSDVETGCCGNHPEYGGSDGSRATATIAD
jgi:hypothetical protein